MQRTTNAKAISCLSCLFDTLVLICGCGRGNGGHPAGLVLGLCEIRVVAIVLHLDSVLIKRDQEDRLDAHSACGSNFSEAVGALYFEISENMWCKPSNKPLLPGYRDSIQMLDASLALSARK